MPLTVALDAGMPIRLGKRRLSTGTITFDDSYPTNGEAYTLADLGMQRNLDVLGFVGDFSGYHFDWDKANGRIKVFRITATIKGGEAGMVAIGIASDAADVALSKTTATDRAGITGIAHAEVANTASLATVIVRFWALGW